MSLAAMVRRMGEAGATPEAIAIALEEIEAMQALLDARRAADRDRKRDQRARDKSADVTGQSGDNPGTVTPAAPSPDKSPPHPQKLTPNPCVHEPRARGAPARLPYRRLPEGWAPTRPLPPRTQAKADQWPPGALDDELAALHRWAANASDAAGRGRKRDWDKAWVNWIERRHDEHFRRTGSGAAGAARHPPRDGLSATTRAALRVFGPPGAGGEPSLPR